MNSRIAITIAVLALGAGCTAPTYYSKSEVLNIKRNPDVVSIDNGNLVPESKIALSGSCQAAIGDGAPRVFNDTVVTSKDFSTMTTYINSNVYESALSGSLEAMYGIKDELAAGFLGDFSLKSQALKDNEANKTTCDIGLFLRAVGDIYNVRFGIRPELLLSSINGRKTFSDSTTYSGEMHYYYVSERLTLFARYNIQKVVALFGGIQQKRVVFMEREDELQYENLFGAYAGLTLVFGLVEVAPYLTIPIESDYTATHSPYQVGIKTTFTVQKP